MRIFAEDADCHPFNQSKKSFVRRVINQND